MLGAHCDRLPFSSSQCSAGDALPQGRRRIFFRDGEIPIPRGLRSIEGRDAPRRADVGAMPDLFFGAGREFTLSRVALDVTDRLAANLIDKTDSMAVRSAGLLHGRLG